MNPNGSRLGEILRPFRRAEPPRPVNPYLVQPGAVLGKVHEPEVPVPPLQSLHRGLAPVGAPVVHHPEHPAGRVVGLGGHDLVDQAIERLDPGVLLAPAEHLGAVDVPRGQVLQGPAPVVLVLHPHGPGPSRGKRGVAPAPGLDGGLLVGGHHEVPLTQGLPLPSPLVQVEHPGGLGLEVGIPGEDPAAEGPRAQGVLIEPSPHRGGGDGGHDPPSDDLGADVGNVQPGKRHPEFRRELAGQGLDLNHHHGGERPPGVPGGAAHPAPGGVLRRTACATWRRSARAATARRR